MKKKEILTIISPIMDEFELYIDRLRAGEYKEFSLKTDSSLMQSEDNEFLFEDDIEAFGEATLTDEHVVINITIKTKVKNHCTICNEPISHEVLIEEKHIPLPIKDARGAIFSLKPFVREKIFLSIPKYSECGGSCPERETLSKYIKSSEDPLEG